MTRIAAGRRLAPVVCLCALVASAGCRTETQEGVETTTPVAVTTAVARRGDIRGVVHAAGIIAPAPGAELLVVAPETARILEIPRAEGDRVQQGDLLVRFEIPGSAAEVEKQQAEVTRAQAGVEAASAAQTRATELFDRGVAARRDMEDATRTVADAAAALAQAQAALAAAQAVADRARVLSTFAGVVANRYHNPGDLVEATSSDPVLRVVDPGRLEVIAAVPLTDSSRIQVGAAGHLLSDSASAAEPTLRVASRPTSVEPGTGTVRVRLRFSRPASLPVGSPVQVDIDAEQHSDVVLVPVQAIVREGEDVAVFVARDGLADRRSVQIGLTDGTNVEVLSGLSAGDEVIVDGHTGLPDGAPITTGPQPPDDDAAPGSAPS